MKWPPSFCGNSEVRKLTPFTSPQTFRRPVPQVFLTSKGSRTITHPRSDLKPSRVARNVFAFGFAIIVAADDPRPARRFYGMEGALISERLCLISGCRAKRSLRLPCPACPWRWLRESKLRARDRRTSRHRRFGLRPDGQTACRDPQRPACLSFLCRALAKR